MILSISYQTSKLFFGRSMLGHQFNDEDEVILKTLDLYSIYGWWLEVHEYETDYLTEAELKELKTQATNESSIYSHIWRHNNSVQNKDPDKFNNVPKFIVSGEVLKSPVNAFRPFLVVEYLKGMRPPRGQEEHDAVEIELAKLKKIGVIYRDHRDANFLFDPKTKKAYVFDFEHAELTV
ncbi:unnamed protein product [Ambrosiozyma monospora]|uniref:Unnamed protein product n=1 Tax=Ambrosiozyma monospora TaxID=43982 RepID=A0ACB5T1P2_AMBMO|nr:unnamed protein product [Ambrosiozyma monospora]